MMVEAMQRAFKQNLEFIDWMSPQSAEAARAKLEHMVDLIGYPAFVLNNTWLDQGKKIILHPHHRWARGGGVGGVHPRVKNFLRLTPKVNEVNTPTLIPPR